MQVTPLPVPVVPTSLPQDAAAKTAAVAQVTAPLVTQNAVKASPKSDRGNQTRSNSEKAKGGSEDGSNRGKSVNLKV